MAFTLVTFHAHPDDEAIATGGTMARAKVEGHRVVLVVATRGELGEPGPNTLGDGEALADRRVAETLAAAEILGVDRVEFLGYHDSGMSGEPTNDAPGAFAAAPIEEAAARLARILEEEHADVLTTYDENGGYGHPDHIQVNRVGRRAGELARTTCVLEATINREHFLRLMAANPEALESIAEEERPTEVETLGVPEAQITTFVDVRDHIAAKRAAMSAHASQIGPESFFLAMPDDVFRESFGYEWFIRTGAPPGTRDDDVFATLVRR
ncbi:MAG: PIG-L family deacetylase [Actinomycetota bacterium]